MGGDPGAVGLDKGKPVRARIYRPLLSAGHLWLGELVDKGGVKVRVKVLLDTDIGDDIDDAWALSFCLCHPKVELVGVTTVWGNTEIRAALARMLIERAGRRVEVVAGSRDGLDRHVALRRPVYAEALGPEEARLGKGRTDAIRFMAEMARKYPGLVLLTIGPLTNAARFAVEFPEEFGLLSRHVMMCGHLIPGRAEPEYNAGCDPRATQIAFSTKVPKFVVGLDVTLKCQLSEDDLRRLKAKGTPLSNALFEMTRLWQRRTKGTPVMHDPLAAMSIVEEGVVEFEPMRVAVDESGRLKRVAGRPNVNFAVFVNPDLLRRRLLEVIG